MGERALDGARVVVLGASTNKARYSYRAVSMLADHGFEPIPVHPSGRSVLERETKRSLPEVDGSIDTLTVYVNASISDPLYDAIVALNPRRVVFNPGAENPHLATRLHDLGIEVVEACTLVMLSTNQF